MRRMRKICVAVILCFFIVSGMGLFTSCGQDFDEANVLKTELAKSGTDDSGYFFQWIKITNTGSDVISDIEIYYYALDSEGKVVSPGYDNLVEDTYLESYDLDLKPGKSAYMYLSFDKKKIKSLDFAQYEYDVRDKSRHFSVNLKDEKASSEKVDSFGNTAGFKANNVLSFEASFSQDSVDSVTVTNNGSTPVKRISATYVAFDQNGNSLGRFDLDLSDDEEQILKKGETMNMEVFDINLYKDEMASLELINYGYCSDFEQNTGFSINVPARTVYTSDFY